MNDSIMVVTGSSRGIGRGIATFFLEQGYTVIGCSRSESTIVSSAYHHFQVDLTNETEVLKFVREIRTRFKKVDVLICNVGLIKSALFMGITSGELLNSFIQTNFVSAFYICREISKLMLLKKTGRIINIASTMTALHEPGTSAYSSTKTALIEMTKVMARELASQGITCNILSPSMVDTESHSGMGEDWEEKMLSIQTLQRKVSIEELCNVISFYISPLSSCITGQVIQTCLVS